MTALATSTVESIKNNSSCFDSMSEALDHLIETPGAVATVAVANEIATSLMQYATNPEGYGAEAEDYLTVQGATKIDVLTISYGQGSTLDFTYTVNDGEVLTGEVYVRSGCAIVV